MLNSFSTRRSSDLMAYRCLYDKNWTMQFISSGATKLTGYKPEELIENKKRSFASIIHPDDRKLGKSEISKALKGRHSFEIEYRIISKKNEVKWIWEKGKGVYNEKGKLLYIEGFINDISERKLAEQELKQRWLNYRNLLDSLPIGIFIHVNGKIQFGNKMAYQIAEISGKDNLDTFSLVDFLLPEDRPFGVERIKRAMSGEDTPFVEYKVITRKGKHKVISKKSSPIIFDSTRAVQIVIQDITHEKRLEEDKIRARLTEQTNKELQNEISLRVESEQKLKAIFESTAHLIWTINRRQEITSFNTKYAETVKTLCRAELKKGMRVTAFKSFFSKEDYAALRKCYEQSFKGKNQFIETKFVAADGKTYYREIYLHPIIINRQITEIAAIAQDVTERKNYERQIVEQSARLRAIFKSGSQLMWTVNRKMHLTSFNKNYADAIYELYGTYPELDTDIKRMPERMRAEEYGDFWNDKYEEVLKGKSVEFDTERTAKGGKKIYRHIFLHPIFGDKKEVLEVSAIGYDITAQKKAQEEIINKQSQLSAIINTTDDIIFSIDRQFRLVEYNDVLVQIVKQRSSKRVKAGAFIFDLLPASQREELRKTYERALKGESVSIIESFLVKGTERYYEAHYNPIRIEGSITGVAVFSRDITYQKRNEEEILNKQSRLSAIINNTHDIILSIDRNYCLIEFNEVLRGMVKKGFHKELKQGMSVFETMAPAYHAEMKEIYARVFKGESVSSVGLYGEGLNKLFLETHYNPIRTADKITGIAIFSRDISEQKKSEEEVLKSLKEQEVRLKAVHHRVTNNLQVISSILNLQTAYLKDKGTINLLKECQNRIKTMAFIHESLYQNKDFSQINFSEYIMTLVKNLFYSFEVNQQKIRTNFAVDPIFLNLDMSIPCGLIMNELVSNALKYAFNDGREGTIFITLKKHEGKIKMVVSDNGKGIPENIDYKNTETLGLQLVTTLTEQINGTITMNRNKGTTFEIIF